MDTPDDLDDVITNLAETAEADVCCVQLDKICWGCSLYSICSSNITICMCIAIAVKPFMVAAHFECAKTT